MVAVNRRRFNQVVCGIAAAGFMPVRKQAWVAPRLTRTPLLTQAEQTFLNLVYLRSELVTVATLPHEGSTAELGLRQAARLRVSSIDLELARLQPLTRFAHVSDENGPLPGLE